MEEQTQSAQNLTIEEMIKLGEKVDYWQKHVDYGESFGRPRRISFKGSYRGINLIIGEFNGIRAGSHPGSRESFSVYYLDASIGKSIIGAATKEFSPITGFYHEVQRKYEHQKMPNHCSLLDY